MLDDEARTAVRQKLIEYMKSHRIGVPTLAGRISAASPRRLELPIKTLQRFLVGRMRTNDVAAEMCAQFAETVAPPDIFAEFAASLAKIYPSRDASKYAGSYKFFLRNIAANDENEHGEAVVSADKGFCRITERIRYLKTTINDGILIATDMSAMVFLRDRLTKAFKHYAMDESGVGIGVMSRSISLPDSVTPIYIHQKMERL